MVEQTGDDLELARIRLEAAREDLEAALQTAYVREGEADEARRIGGRRRRTRGT